MAKKALFILLAFASVLLSTGFIQPASGKGGGPEVSSAVHHDVSGSLSSLSASPTGKGRHEMPRHPLVAPAPSRQPDGAVQGAVSTLAAAVSGLGFAGVGNGDYGFSPNAAPPDTNLAVGDTQVVQWVNESFAIFNKSTGALIAGPLAGNTLWAGFGGGCETNNDGDPIVQWDQQAHRWIFTQFSVSTTPYLQCVAVSTTADATGAYNRYSFQQPFFPDYPKLSLWPDAYYITYNMFNGNSFAGGRVCAMDRSSMVAGNSATQVCFQLSTSYGGLLPSDLDTFNTNGAPDPVSLPPAGSPNFVMNFGSNSLNLWKFHVDFVTPANSTLAGPTNIPVASFSAACNGGTCIPQQGTRQKLDSLADRLMYRLAYRHFSDGHESLVVNHSVTAGTRTGIRWYEIRNPNSTPTVYQQSTFAPSTDSLYRWMGSIAMDKVGDIAVGYSVSSSRMYPSISYTGRLATDALNTMQAETLIKAGTGSQLRNLSRWGDYSAMDVDPVDGCTFWYTTEYLKSSGTFNWSTWITSFKFPGCQ